MESFRFIVIGDCQGENHGVNKEILHQLLNRVSSLSHQPSFILFTGDIIEGNGEQSEELLYWQKIITEYYPVSILYPTIGNHNYDEESFSEVFKHLPDNGPSGYNRTVYYFDYGNSRFFCLNSNRGKKISSSQREWLKKHIRQAVNRGLKHIFVYFHQPAFPVGKHLGSSLDQYPVDRNTFWQLLDKYRIDLVFNGHEHIYCRRLIDSSMNSTVEGKEFVFQNSVYQIITGGGGADLYEIYNMKNVIVGPIEAYHYVVVDVSGSKVNVNVYSLDNELLDSFTVEKPDLKHNDTTYEDINLPKIPESPQKNKKKNLDKIIQKKFFFPPRRDKNGI